MEIAPMNIKCISLCSDQLIGNTLLGENYLTRATLTEKMPKNTLIRRRDVHPSTQTIPELFTRTILLTDSGEANRN